MLQSTTMPSSNEGDEQRPASPAIDDTQQLKPTRNSVHVGAGALIMGYLASQEICKLDLDNAESCEGFMLGISICASAVESMYPDNGDGPNLPFSW